jgi:hypothetical protein
MKYNKNYIKPLHSKLKYEYFSGYMLKIIYKTHRISQVFNNTYLRINSLFELSISRRYNEEINNL